VRNKFSEIDNKKKRKKKKEVSWLNGSMGLPFL
jgi:hypothetical protein